ncbi:MAG: GNAT family N-acetyltransferase, partial [Planctomycetota bacterium]|nr:GNAT family N-acetyltransferase [Planctomycetota bacterium]
LSDASRVIVATHGDRLVGYDLCSSKLRGDTGALEFVGVSEGMRSRGIGGALIARGLEALRDAGMSAVETWTDYDSPLLRWCCSMFRFRIHRRWLAYEMPLR